MDGKSFWSGLIWSRARNRTEKLEVGGRRSSQAEGLSTVGRRSAQGGLAAQHRVLAGVTPCSVRAFVFFLLLSLLPWHLVLAPRFVQASTSSYSQAWRRFREMTFPGNSHD